MNETDTLYDFEKRMHKAEKGILVSALNRLSYNRLNTFLPNNKKLIKRARYEIVMMLDLI